LALRGLIDLRGRNLDPTQPRPSSYWLYIPVAWIMQARTLVVLKRNVERAARVRPHTVASPEKPSVESQTPAATA
jgi:hypothetical protein